LAFLFLVPGKGDALGSSADEFSAAESPAAEASGTNRHQGIDVSHHDEGIQWPAVRDSGVTFVYIKATEGIDFTDPLFEDHWDNAGKAGLLRGAYHFFRALDDGATQARFFLDTVFSHNGEKRHGELIPVVDVEAADGVDPETLLAELKVWLEKVEEATGAKPMIYTGVGFWNRLGDNAATTAFASYPLWIAEYEVQEPTLPGAWDSWTLWQYTEDAAVAGIGVPVDQSRTQSPLHVLETPPRAETSSKKETP